MNTIINRIKESNKVKIVDNIEDDQNKAVIKSIMELYRDNKLVPVICDDMFEYKNPNTEEVQSLHSHIVEEIIKNSRSPLKLTETELDDIVKENYYGMSLLESKVGRPLYKDVYTTVMNNGMIKEGIQLKKIVTDFLKACQFPLIVTTSCFGIIENEIKCYKDVWKKYAETDGEEPLPEKCVYHIFDKAVFGNSNWGYNEKQILKYLSSYEGDYSLKMLKSIIKKGEKTLLILGNDTPDWMFRFILKNIYGDNLYDDNMGLYMGENDKRENAALNLFLKDISFDKESQLVSVLDTVTKNINDSGNNTDTKQEKYHIFLAHASEDEDNAKKLYEYLTRLKLKVWADFLNIKDGHYWERIINGINNSNYFMPLLTRNYIDKNLSLKLINPHLPGKDVISYKECETLETYNIKGVQIELILASRYLDRNSETIRNKNDNNYSMPIMIKDCDVEASEIATISNQDNAGEYKLPSNLFRGIQFNTFNPDYPDELEMDWKRYKNQ